MKRAEEIVRRAEDKRGFKPVWMRFMAGTDLDFLEAYERIYDLVGVRATHLPAKFRELIVVAVVAVKGYDAGIRDHIRRAFRLGATKEEILEVLQSAYFHTGALTLVHGLIALMEVLEEQKKGKHHRKGRR